MCSPLTTCLSSLHFQILSWAITTILAAWTSTISVGSASSAAEAVEAATLIRYFSRPGQVWRNDPGLLLVSTPPPPPRQQLLQLRQLQNSSCCCCCPSPSCRQCRHLLVGCATTEIKLHPRRSNKPRSRSHSLIKWTFEQQISLMILMKPIVVVTAAHKTHWRTRRSHKTQLSKQIKPTTLQLHSW